MGKEIKVKCPKCQKIIAFKKIGSVNGFYGWVDQSSQPPYHILYITSKIQKVICPFRGE